MTGTAAAYDGDKVEGETEGKKKETATRENCKQLTVSVVFVLLWSTCQLCLFVCSWKCACLVDSAYIKDRTLIPFTGYSHSSGRSGDVRSYNDEKKKFGYLQ
ncbi:unnamed protein product [Ceratitis capitata]|uniref:(Mediterranean fruit fly) hypothetical protein n=1 Tax=Ceratitis capitata TaxID=7213 RepID=A0A811UE50_CERCA|nr:unnamed protein product [Ceratitis capitata]